MALLLAVLWAGPLRSRLSDLQSAHDAQLTALLAGRTAAVDFTSYTAAGFDADVARVRAELTGTILDNFTKNLTGIRAQFAAGSGNASVASVKTAATVTASRTEAAVIIGLDIAFTRPGHAPVTSSSLLQLHLVHRHARWLVDAITTVV